MLSFREANSASGIAALRTVARFEWANCVYRLVAGVVGTIIVYPESEATWAFYGGIVAFNLVLLSYALRRRGPLTQGRWGLTLEVLHSLVVMLLVGVFMPERSYFSQGGAVPFSTYAAGTAGLLVLVPRSLKGGEVRRRLVGYGMDFVLPISLFGVFFVSGVINGYAVEEIDVAFVALQVVWTGGVVLLGYLILGLSVAFSKAETKVVRTTYETFADWLHSELKGDIAVLRGTLSTQSGDLTALNRLVDELELKVGAERLRLLLTEGDLLVADILAHNIERFRWLVTYREIPAVGAWVIPNSAGRMLNRILGDLLSNAVKARALSVDIGLTKSDRYMAVSVSDDGPGFSDEVLNDPSTSLFRLRATLEQNQGSLTKRETSKGTTMTAAIYLGP
jgi:hypothetical protein